MGWGSTHREMTSDLPEACFGIQGRASVKGVVGRINKERIKMSCNAKYIQTIKLD